MEISDEFDELRMYVGKPFHINDKITVYQPTVMDVIDFGEKNYYSGIHLLTCIPSDMKSQLWDMGIDYMEITDFQLFALLSRSLTPEQTRLTLGDLDLSKFENAINNQNNELILVNEEDGIIIDRAIYEKMVQYIRKVHGIVPKIENALNKTTKKILIELDRQKLAKQSKEGNKSQLKELISAMSRYPGFPYKLHELDKCPLGYFMDCVQGSQIYVASTSLIKGMYSGMIDTSKISKEEMNWLRSVN